MLSRNIGATKFKSVGRSAQVAQLEQRLENIVQIQLKLKKRKDLSPKRLRQIDQGIGETAVPLVGEILQALAPNAFPNIHDMDEQVIWDIYWRFQNGPAGATMSIFDLFAELDKNIRLFFSIPLNV